MPKAIDFYLWGDYSHRKGGQYQTQHVLEKPSSCNVSDKGQELFDSMEAMYDLKPKIETFTYGALGVIDMGKEVHDENQSRGC